MNKTAITLWLAEISSLLTSALAALSALPFEQGDISLIIPPAWKPVLFKWSLIATVVLRLLISAINVANRILTKSQIANLTELSKAPLIAALCVFTLGLTSCGWRDPAPKFAFSVKRILPLLATIFVFAFCFTGCTAWNAENRRATASALTADAVKILGKIAVGQIKALATAELGGNSDYAHSAAAAAWSSVDAHDLADLINDATGHKAPALAAAASNIALDAVENGFSKDKAISAVASAISASAFVK
tara:strand:- start:858 stop:1601 length:744 start_codon:yes stop_codon:yes gene_type:complete